MPKENDTKIKLTKSSVDGMQCPQDGQVIVYDSKLPGFGVRLTPGSKTYIAQARVEGKVVRVKLGVHGPITAEQARQLAQIQLGSMATGINPNVEKERRKIKAMTLAELYGFFRAAREPHLRPATLKIYDGAMRRCFHDWKDLPIVSISKDMIEKRHVALSNAHGPRGKGDAHANQAMRFLRTLFNYAITVEADAPEPVIQINPVKRLSEKKIWNKNVRRKTIVSQKDLPAWFEGVMNLQNETIRDYLLLLIFTGLRRTEAAKLKWSDINFNDQTITIVSEHAKNAEEHVIPMSDYVLSLMEMRKAAVVSKYGDCDELIPQSLYVFPGEGKHAHLVESKHSIGLVKVKFSPHDLRRTFLTVLESLDVSVYTVKRFANHKMNSDVTAGYVVTDIGRLREPMQRVTDAILTYVKSSNSAATEPDMETLVAYVATEALEAKA